MGNYGSRTIAGESGQYDQAGYRVSGIGDINGDGIDDFAVTAKRGENYYGQDTGSVFVVFGEEDADLDFSLEDIDGDNGFQILPDSDLNYGSYSSTFGSSIVGLGDVNGDGYDDFGIAHNATAYGSYGYYGYYGYSEYGSGYGAGQGVAYVIFGGQDFSGTTHMVDDLDHVRLDVEGEISDLLNLGDLNGDGFNDIGVVERTQDRVVEQEFLYVYDANDNGVYDYDPEENPDEYLSWSDTRQTRVDTLTGYIVFGTNEDIESDDPIADQGGSDVVFDLTDLSSERGASVELGEQANTYYGGYYSEAAFTTFAGGEVGGYDDDPAGMFGGIDLNGDGFDDLVTRRGSVYYDTDGTVYYFRSPESDGYYSYSYSSGVENFGDEPTVTSGDDQAQVFINTQMSVNQDMDILAGLGNFSGDDDAEELAVGGFAYDDDFEDLPVFTWGVYVLNGRSDIFDSAEVNLDPTAVEAGEASFFFSTQTYELGETEYSSRLDVQMVLGLGDMNEDGIDDMLIAGTRYLPDFGTHVQAYIVLGTEAERSGLFDLDEMVDEGSAYVIIGDTSNSYDRIWMANAGDVNGDGAADIIIGDPSDNSGNGVALVIHGGVDALEASDNADGDDDNRIANENTRVDVETGLVAIQITIQDGYVSTTEKDSEPSEVTFTLGRTGDLSGEVTVNYAVEGGSTSYYSYLQDASEADFEGGAFPTGTATFAAGEATTTITVQIAGDTLNEGTEDFSVVLSDPEAESGAPVSIVEDRGQALIYDNDQPVSFYSSHSYVLEGDAESDNVVLRFTVVRTGKQDTAASVDYVISPYSVPSISADNDDIEGEFTIEGTLEFASGQSVAYIDIPIAEDTQVESTEYLTLTLSNAYVETGTTNFTSREYTGVITNDDVPAQFWAYDTSVTESDDETVDLIFEIVRGGDTTVDATVDYRLQGVSAIAADFESGFIDPDTGEPYEGTLEFAAGETSKFVTLKVVGDQLDEGTERVNLYLSNATADSADPAEIVDSIGNGDIYDDDQPVYFSVNDPRVTEGDTGDDRTLTFTVTRSGATEVAASVEFSLEAYVSSNAADEDDFASGFPQSGMLEFAAGETQKTVTAVVSGDEDVEPDEYVQLILSNPDADGENAEISDASGIGYIYNDDQPVIFRANGVTVDEGDEGDSTTMTLRVFRSGETGVAATLDYEIVPYTSSQQADADDFSSTFPTDGTLEFAAGETFKDITLTVQGDDIEESDEYAQVLFSNPTADGVATRLDTGSVILTIRNDDEPVHFSANYASATEGDDGATTPLTFTISRTGDTDVAASVGYDLTPYSSTSLTAEAGDFVGGLPRTGTVEFAAGETSKSLTFDIIDDNVFEGTEYVELRLKDPSAPGHPQGATAATNTYLGFISDDEIPVYFRVYRATTTERDTGETSTLQFLVQRSGDTNVAATIDYSVDSYPYSGATDADVVGNLPKTGTLSFAAGETSKYVEVEVEGDDAVEGTEYLKIDISNAVSADPNALTIIQTSQSYGTIIDDDVPTYFRVSGQTVMEGDTGDSNQLSFTVVRSGDVSAAASVSYNIAGGTANGDDFDSEWPTSGVLSFAAFETSKTVTLGISGDEDIEGDEYTYMTLSNPTSADSSIEARLSNTQASAIIRNDDLPAYISVNSSAYVTEGNPGEATALTYTVSRYGDTTSSVSVEYNFAGDGYTPLDTSDFEGGLPQAGTLTFAAGETSRTLSFAIAEDEDIEGHERGRLTLSDPTVVSGDPDATVQITRAVGYGIVYNDDFAPRITMTANGSTWGASVAEGNSGYTDVVLAFVRDGDTDGEVTVNFDLLTNTGSVFAADSNDIDGFLPKTGNSVTIADGETTATYTVRINGDGLIEANESFRAQITSVGAEPGKEYQLVNSSSTITIRNDDGRPPIPELPFDVDGDGVIEDGEFIRVEADVFGDPHIVTLDGLGYDFQAVGEYVLVETTDGATNPFSVQVRFEAFPGSDLVSVTTRMAVEVKGKVIEIDALDGDTPLLIDGVPASLTDAKLSGIDLDDSDENGRDIFAEDGGKFFIKLNDAGEMLMVGLLDGALNVCVFLGDPAKGGNAGAVRGLMGNANQDLTDDFALRDGSDIPDSVISFDDEGVPSLTFDYIYGKGTWEGASYRESWELTTGEALFSGDTPDFPEGFPAAPLSLDNLPTSVRDAAEQAARDAGLDPDDTVIFESAVLDFALTGMGAFLGGATQLAATPEAASVATEAPDVGPTVSVAADATSITEGDDGVSEVAFTFYRAGSSEGALEVDYQIGGDVDASDLGDDTPMSGTVSFDDGEDEVTLTIIVKGDLTTEGSEALSVAITGTNNDGVLVAGAQGETTIVTDDFDPEAQDDAASGDAGEEITGNLLDDNGQGPDADADDDTLTISRVFIGALSYAVADGAIALGDGRSLSVESDGNFSFDTGTFYNTLAEGAVDTLVFDYEVLDGNGGRDTATVTLSVSGTAQENGAPVAMDDVYDINEDDPTYLYFMENDTDPDEDELEATIDAEPSNGSLVFDGEGWIYTPDANFFGSDSFTYDISDGNGGESGATVTINVAPVQDAPVFDPVTPFSIAENTSAVGSVSATDADLEELVFSIADGGDGELFDINSSTGAISFRNAPDFEAPLDTGGDNTYAFAVAVTDGTAVVTQAVQVSVTDVDDTGPEIIEIVGTTGRDLLRGSAEDEVFLLMGGVGDVAYGLGGADVFDFSDNLTNGRRDNTRIVDWGDDDSLAGIVRSDVNEATLRQSATTLRFAYGDDQDILTITGDVSGGLADIFDL
ncbi:Calx-beta domain-containing protein [Poseidonocella pacifica]|uniref:Calx-beta domain-containing protein n=1 Tax=Poseidonocella pacifica TaxID=871651 RepID=A0A1I0YMC1_9RHOB|nr:Calx-beta domain-containing protein [Poseidonocella pacifica]SFB14352.1 Calx-beta domain-containing protein [Poseidonocella pacifica]